MEKLTLKKAAKYIGFTKSKLAKLALNNKIHSHKDGEDVWFTVTALDNLKRKLENEKCEQNAVFTKKAEIEAEIIEKGGTPVAVLAKMIAGKSEEDIIKSCICE